MASSTHALGRARLLIIEPRLKWLALIALSLACSVGLWYAGQVVVLDHLAAAALDTSVAHASAPLRPGTPIGVSVDGAGAELLGVVLTRTETGQSAEQPIDVQLEPLGPTTWNLVPTQGELLRPDGTYRLGVRLAIARPALPLPRTDVLERDFRFTTVPSPHPSLPTQVLHPAWGEPVSLAWSLPLQSLSVVTEPTAGIRAWVDSNDATQTFVQLGEDALDGQTYTVRVVDALSTDGVVLQQPGAMQIAIPARPSFVDAPSAPVTLKVGDSFTLTSSTDLRDVQVTSTGDPPTRSSVDGNHVRIELAEFRQGAHVDVTIASATSTQGAPLRQSLRVQLQTPAALGAPKVEPEDGTTGVPPASHPAITFPEPVADQNAATSALSIDPPVPGHWDWTAPERVEFVPDDRLPVLTHFDVRVHGGPDGPRSVAGGYLDADDLTSSFRTTDYKRIDVSLSRQIMTIYENDAPIRTFYVATGVAAAPTPTGTFAVQYKMPQARFRGVNPDGSHYDIPDVHWVMPFLGDYTIHGAYWRGRFGTPGSDGCVSLPDADAKVVFDWANEGTPVTIHY